MPSAVRRVRSFCVLILVSTIACAHGSASTEFSSLLTPLPASEAVIGSLELPDADVVRVAGAQQIITAGYSKGCVALLKWSC
jgi:hypothetical protein